MFGHKLCSTTSTAFNPPTPSTIIVVVDKVILMEKPIMEKPIRRLVEKARPYDGDPSHPFEAFPFEALRFPRGKDVPLPVSEGPKLHPFRPFGTADIKWIAHVAVTDQSIVWKVEIDGVPYALKIVRRLIPGSVPPRPCRANVDVSSATHWQTTSKSTKSSGATSCSSAPTTSTPSTASAAHTAASRRRATRTWWCAATATSS